MKSIEGITNAPALISIKNNGDAATKMNLSLFNENSKFMFPNELFDLEQVRTEVRKLLELELEKI